LHIKTGFVESMGYQKSGKVTMTNYIDKVEVVREANRQGFELGELGKLELIMLI